ncbi:carbonyl reductase [NADPH] 3 isoform X3 [Heterocephalus glaber]|uniref:Carbonyl reductase [NADPH] 3 isoform X3 n=1 Tax=Heterocephalus glaber TaxID=10181 RepID=A0AAX6SSQ9_HETGA|nr:carbonyl reductase [NADPH] 3 isoform X3 [Heterocephalus glaber]
MSSCSRVALVTGANKGIGFAITRDLCRRFSGDVVLTARDEARGRAAVQQLQAEGLSPRFHQLDIDDLQSIRAVRDFLRKEYGGLDVLINNAGIAFKMADPTPFHIQAEVTIKTNFYGTRDVCTELLPLIKPGAPDANTAHCCSGQAVHMMTAQTNDFLSFPENEGVTRTLRGWQKLWRGRRLTVPSEESKIRVLRGQ